MRTLLLTVVIITAVAFSDCSRPAPTPKPAVSERLGLTATEEFHLRGECARLADQMKRDTTWPGVRADFVSNYRIKDNRCYVLAIRINTTFTPPQTSVDLFDGQTKKLLAMYDDAEDLGTVFETSSAHTIIKTEAEKYVDEHMQREAK